MGRIAVVSTEDRFIRWSDRAEIHRDRLLHRSVHVMIFDRAGRLVLQRRHPGKLTWPDAWDISVSGHVEEEDYHGGPDDALAEVYARVARRETLEELGIEVALDFVARLPPVEGVHYEMIALYRGVHDGPYLPQPDEVAEVRAFGPEELRRLLASGERVTSALRWMIAEGWIR